MSERPNTRDRDERQDSAPLLRLLLDAMEDAVWVKDREGRYLLANAAAVALLGRPREELLGQDDLALFGAEIAEEHAALEGAVLHSGRPVVMDEYQLKDGAPRVLRVARAPLRGAGGEDDEILGIVGTIREMTSEELAQAALEQGRAELESCVRERTASLTAAMEELRRAKLAAEAASRAKDAFLAMVSHELRTPMNGIVGMASLLADSDIGAEQREQAQTLLRSGQALLAILNDVIEFARLSAGQATIARAAFDLVALIDGVLEVIGPAPKPGVRVEGVRAPALPRFVLGDGPRLRQILLQLLDNAVKFTRAGVVRLRVESVAAERVRFCVEDSGIGMDAAQQARLFLPFQQGESSATRSFGGMGLGLSLCQRVCGLLGGVIEVESAAGQGSRFFFSLPLPVVAVPGEAGAQTVAEASLGPARVLVVEDNLVNQRVAVALLKKLGLQVEVANDGAEALERLSRDRGFHLVLMDCQMPVLDGISATRRLRALEPADAPRLPVVALTANTLPEDRAACADAGMDDFLEKPVNAAKLRAVLARLLPRRAA